MADQRPLQGRKLGDRRVVVDRPHARYFQYLGPGVLEAELEAQAPRTPYQRRSKDDAGRGGRATQTSRRSLQPRRRERSDSDPPCALHPVHSTGRPSRQTIADIADLCHSSTNDRHDRWIVTVLRPRAGELPIAAVEGIIPPSRSLAFAEG